MTDDVVSAEGSDVPEAPSGHYYASLLGRKILVKEINAAQSMMLGTIYRNLGRNGIEDGLSALGRLGTLFEALIALPHDRDFLEEAILRGKVELADFAGIFKAAEKDMVEEPVAPKKPRRGRQ